MNPTKLSITERNMLLNKTATFLERNPEKYNFFDIHVPSSIEESGACIIGWMGFFLEEEDFDEIIKELGFKNSPHFYSICGNICEEMGEDRRCYKVSATIAARVLREIASRNYPINLPARESHREFIPED